MVHFSLSLSGAVPKFAGMFSREEAKQRRKDFWTAYGIYMRQHRSVRGTKVKWVNYKTGIRHMYFRLEADHKHAYVAIDLQHPDPGIRELFFQQWEELQELLHGMTEQIWQWEEEFYLPEGKQISRIYTELTDVNMFRQEDWRAIFEFFAGAMVPLDEIWGQAGEIFEELAG